MEIINNEKYYKSKPKNLSNIPLFNNIIKYFNYSSNKYPNFEILKIKRNNKWEKWTFNQYKIDIYKCAKSILKLNISTNCSININSYNCPEWCIAFYGSMFTKHMASGIYTSSSPKQCEYYFNESKGEMVFVEDEERLKKYLEIKENIPNCKAIVIMETISKEQADYSNLPFKVFKWNEFLELGKDMDDSVIDEISSSIEKSDIVSLVFTSGTGALPKPCMISHKNFISLLYWGSQYYFPKGIKYCEEIIVSYLPMSHIAEQNLSIIYPLLLCCQIIFSDRDALKGTLVETLKEAKPTIFFGAPRLWEKIQVKIETEMNLQTGIKKTLLNWAMGVASQNSSAIKEKLPTSYSYMIAKNLILKKIFKGIGLENCYIFINGAASISSKTKNFFSSIGINISNFYGLTETTGPICSEYPIIKNSCGVITDGECKIATNGEICFRGDFIFEGYYNNPEATKEVFDKDGWFHTGDIGDMDEEGYIYVTDRKKEIIITAGGENISPVFIESKVRLIPGVEQAVYIGDKQKFCVCLITISLDFLKFLKSKNNYPYTVPESYADIPNDKYLYQYIDEHINSINKDLSRVQTIKKFKILPLEFSEGSEDSEMTSTKKLKRRIVNQKYINDIKELYGEFYSE